MRKLDVFVLPSHEEALPYVVLEAMTCRRPVVSYRVGGIPEAITDGEHGLLVERRDVCGLVEAVLRCLENPTWARQLGEQARARVVTDFHAAEKVRALERVYEEALSRRSNNGFGR
jgi:glycosyltransferase involved in cell wall biosynthesis|tara:strand:+ start:106 stop:453 length:348 start_codon:yes stop_codon:yes gene_type:complete